MAAASCNTTMRQQATTCLSSASWPGNSLQPSRQVDNQKEATATAGSGKSLLQWLGEELALSFFIATFFLQLWSWMAFVALLYYVPLSRLPLLGYLAYIWVGPGRHSPKNPSNWAPYPLRYAPWHRAMASYFPISMVRDVALDPNQRYVFCFAPHGLCTVGAWVNFCTEATGFSRVFPGIELHPLTLASNLRTPFFREYLLGHGIGDCSKASCLNILARGSGSAILLAVGGATESLLGQPGTYNLCIKRRRGFVRVALQSGAWIVPVISFGENDHYSTLNSLPHNSRIRRFQRFCEKALGFTIPLAIGRGPLGLPWGLLPYRKRTVVVTGPPVQLEKWEGDVNSEEFAARVDEVHAQYCTALTALFDKYKEQYAPDRKSDLTFVE